jgi:purine nucleosidase
MHWIIDTDAGVDDAIAIVLPFVPNHYPDFHLAAITTVTGNVHVDKVNINVGALLDLLDADVPFFSGCVQPLIEPHVHAQEFHGVDGLGDAGLSKTDRRPEAEHAALALSRLSKLYAEDGFGIIALGPLTNLALAVSLDPELPQRVKTLITMAGAWQARGNQSPAAEYNVSIDPEAAKVVFERFDNIIMLPWEVSLDQGMSWDQLFKVAGSGTHRAKFLNAMMPLAGRWKTKYGFSGVPLPDPLAVMIALDKSIVTKDIPCRVNVDIGHDSGRGLTALDRRSTQPNACVVIEVDAAKAWDMLELAWSL